MSAAQLDRRHDGDPAEIANDTRRLEKWNSFLTTEMEPRILTIQGGNSRTASFLQYQLALNILEAADVDRLLGVLENVDLGLALAASTTDMMSWTDSDGNLRYPYTKGWFDAYVSPHAPLTFRIPPAYSVLISRDPPLFREYLRASTPDRLRGTSTT